MITYNFEPVELKSAVFKVKKQHPLSRVPDIYMPNAEMKKFILSLVSLKPEQLKKKSIALTKKEIDILIGYMPRNTYNVPDMSNLFEIFRYRSNENDSLDLSCHFYRSWQNSYSNVDCNKLIIHYLLENKENNFVKMLSTIGLDANGFRSILDHNIPYSYGMKLKSDKKNRMKKLEEGLQEYGVNKNSVLYSQCEFMLYTFCSAETYLECDREEFIKRISDYTKQMEIHKLFLENFLSELTLGQLSKFEYLIGQLNLTVGELDSKKFNEYFKDFDPVLISKYRDWINTNLIDKVFGKDARSLFWRKYHYIRAEKANKSNAVILHCENHVIIEFLGKASGPLYIYEKSIYETSKIRSELRFSSNNEARQYLLHATKHGEGSFYKGGLRQAHIPEPGWQGNVKWIIKKNDITYLLDYSV